MKKLVDYAAIISAYIIFCGVVKYFIYYKLFAIPILEFVEIQEIFKLFLENVMAFLLIAIFIITQHYLIFKDINPVNDDSYNQKNILSKNNICLFVISIIIITTYYSNNAGVDTPDLAFLIAFVTIYFLLGPYAFIKLSNEFILDKIQVTITMLTIFFISFSIVTGFNEARIVNKPHNIYFGTKIQFKDKSIKISDDSLVYIGMTKNYFFMYNKIFKTSTAYKISELDFIEFHKK